VARLGSRIIREHEKDEEREAEGVGKVETHVQGGVVPAPLGFLHPDEDIICYRGCDG
jgi:hypothetical protein